MRFVRTVFFLGLFLDAAWVSAQGLFTFPNGRRPGNVDQVTAQLKVGGDILEMRAGKMDRVKLGGLADLEYKEETLEVGEGSKGRTRSIRRYDRAEATIRVGNDALRPTLRPNLSLVVASADARTSMLFSPQEPLSRDELELIDTLGGNSVVLDRLLPTGPLAVGHTWKPDAALLAMLLGLDSVGQNDVQCELVEVTDTVARFQMTGSLAATIHGATTQMQLKSKYRYDRRSQRIDWFAMSMKEARAISLVAEGFDVVAQVQVRIVPEKGNGGFDRKTLEDLPLEPGGESELLAYESTKPGWRLTHDRSWFVTHDDPDLVIFHLIRQGQLLAQCRISPLATVPPEKLPPLESFQEDVRRALGQQFDRFVAAGQWANDAKYRVYRVAVSGTARAELKQVTAKAPMEWRYYLVADERGRRMALAVTMEADLVPRVGDADRDLVNAFRFTDAEKE